MSARYFVTVATSGFLIAVFAGLLGAALPPLGVPLMILAALSFYGAGLAFDVLPPGRPAFAWPKPPPLRRPSRDVRFTAAIFAVLGFGLIGATAFGDPPETPTLEALPGSGGAIPDGAAAAAPPPTETTATEPTAEPTATPAEASATASAESAGEAPPVAIDAKTEPPTPTPTPDPIVAETQALQAGWLTGQWEVTNTVESGPGAGESSTIVFELHEAAGQIDGTGGDVTLSGVRQGTSFTIIYRHADGSGGRYEWSTRPDGRLAGTFADEATGNTGTSTARRLT